MAREHKLMVVPMRGWDDPNAHSPCGWDDPNLRKVMICIAQTGEAKIGPEGSWGPIVADINGDRRGFVTEEMCVEEWAKTLATAHLLAAAPELFDAVEHVLIASEDGGDMNDIDWNMLRSAVSRAQGGE